MIYDFNVDEVFEMAEQIERNGSKFYRRMAENISDTPTIQLFLDLAAMEDEHEKNFASMRKDLSDQERKPTVFDPEGDAALYLRALANLRVFDEEGKQDFGLTGDLPEKEKTRKILWTAIGLEKDSIAFYLGMKELVPERLGKNKIDDIINEEMGHIRLLSNRLSGNR
ncbi:MAG: ferritin family protein [Spirochaetales bacterium]|jgi:rubrerythrin|nr:ferritin family protein [Spirochaetales bacterium]